MVFVSGRGFRLGLQLGQAAEADKRAKEYEDARLKAEKEHIEDRTYQLAKRERELADYQREQELRTAEGAANTADLAQVSQEAITQARAEGGLAPGQEGPPTANEAAIQDYFARAADVAKRMPRAEFRAQYLLDARQRIKEHTLALARKQVAEGVQDRLAHNNFNFIGENGSPEPEMNEAVKARVEALMQMLDSPDVDPVAASQYEASILDLVEKENAHRLAVKGGRDKIDAALAEASKGGNKQMIDDLRRLRATWGTGKMTEEELDDRIFEAQHGRKSPREEAAAQAAAQKAAEATRLAVRAKAIQIWQHANPDSTEIPSEAALQKIEQLLLPAGSQPYQPSGLTREQVIREAMAVPGDRQTPGTTEAPSAGPKAPSSPGQFPPSIGLVGSQAAVDALRRPPIPPTPAKKPANGSQPAQARPWAKLKAKERKDAEARLLSVAGSAESPGAAVLAALQELGIDPKSVPPELGKRLLEAAKKRKGPTTGEALSHLHPGAGGM